MFDDETIWKAYEAYLEEEAHWGRKDTSVYRMSNLNPDAGPVQDTIYHFSDAATAKTYIETRCIKAALEAVWPRT